MALCTVTLGACCHDCRKVLCDFHNRAAVTTVDIFPPEVHALPGAEFLWEAVARDQYGAPFSGEMEGAWTPRSLTTTMDPPTSAVIRLPGQTSGDYDEFQVSIGQTTSATAVVHAGAVAQGAQVNIEHPPRARVDIEHVRGEAPVAVLLDGAGLDASGNVACQGDLALAVVGSATVPGFSFSADCPSEAVVFARGHGASRWKGTGTTRASTLSLTQAQLPPSRPLDVYIVDRTGGNAEQEIAWEREGATTLFDLNRVGIWFNAVEARRLQPGPYGTVKATDGACASDAYLAGLLDIPIGQLQTDEAAAMRVYVAYVNVLADDAGTYPKGWICHKTRTRGPVVLISAAKSVTTFPHEMGHALLGEAFGGHDTTDLSNLMNVTDVTCGGATRNHIWLGQAFRMNLDTVSWLLHGVPAAQLMERGARRCQGRREQPAACPAENKDMGEGIP